MTVLFTLFDTNVYRGLSDAKLTEIVTLEADQGVQGLSAYWPLVELLGRCADEDPPFVGYASIKRLREHTRIRTGPQAGQLSILEDGDAQIARHLLDYSIPDRRNNHSGHMVLLMDAADLARADWPEDLLDRVRFVRKQIDEVEAEFAAGMNSLPDNLREFARVKGVTEKEARRQVLRDWENRAEALPYFAGTKVQGLVKKLDITRTEEELDHAARGVLFLFPCAVEFYRRETRKAVQGDTRWEASDNANSTWDARFCFHISAEILVEGAPVLVVVEERRIREAAAAVMLGPFVSRVDDYLALLRAGGVAAHVEEMMAERHRRQVASLDTATPPPAAEA